MPTEDSEPVQIADPTIDQVFDEFLAEQAQRLKPNTLSKYRDVISLLRDHLDGYAYDGLSEEESALFDKHYNAEGDAHKEFCELFGPEEILPNVGMFLSYFMIRKVMAGADLKRAAGTVTKKLAKWLAEKGYADAGAARDATAIGAEAARDLPAAERAGRILDDDGLDSFSFSDPSALPDRDSMDFDHYTITRLEPGKLWLEGLMAGGSTIGPIPVPEEATDLLRERWDISCALARIEGRWRLVDVANVYPH